MMDRAAKLRKLDAFRRSLPHVSGSALAAVLEEIEQSGMPELRSRWDLGRASTLELGHETPYGKCSSTLSLKAKHGSDIKLPVVNPHAFIYRSFQLGGSFTSLVSERLAAVPSTPENPWRIIMYSDEVVPGNPLAHDNRRKVWVIYFSWIELGSEILSNEDAWICVLVARSTEVHKVSAGMGQIFAAVLKLFFGPGPSDLSTAGLALRTPTGEIVRLFCTLGMVLQDGGCS